MANDNIITVDHLQEAMSRVKTELDGKASTGGTLKNPSALTVKGNGTESFKYDGSAAKTLNIKAGTNVSVSSDTSGNITISSSYTNTTYGADTGIKLNGTTFQHTNSVTAATAQGDANKTLSWGGTFTIPTVTYDAQGHITGKGTTTMTMPSNPNTDNNTAHSHSAGVGLVGSGNAGTSGTYDYKAKLRSETALTVDSAAATTTSGRVYPVAVDKTGYLCVNVPWSDTNTDTNTTYTFATGDNNGTIKVTPSGGTASNISVKGLGSAAYLTASKTADANAVVQRDNAGCIVLPTGTVAVDYIAVADVADDGATKLTSVTQFKSSLGMPDSYLALGETSTTAYRGDRGKTAYDHSQAAHAPSNAQKNSDITKAEIEAKLTGTISTHSHSITAPISGDWFNNGYTKVSTDGVMEVGKYIDFHNTDTTTNDYDVRLQCNYTSSSSTGVTITLPSTTGTLALTSHTHTVLTDAEVKSIVNSALGITMS